MAFADDYVDVAERIAQFNQKYPDGTLQTISVCDREVGGKLFVEVFAQAFRTPEDPRPGVGHAREPFPGKTPYTKDSESMNAETSAWGRAIVALGGFSTKKVASADEVRNRKADQAAPKVTTPKTLTAAQLKSLQDRLADVDPAKVSLGLGALGVPHLNELTTTQANELVSKVAA